MEKIRVVYFGTPKFSCEVLKALIDEDYFIVGVVSQCDKPVGRKKIIELTPVHCLCDEYDLNILQPENLKEEVDSILALEPDLIVTCAYGQFIPDQILEYPKYGSLNIHPSLLPKYRGGAPVHRCLMNGDTQSGVCLMEMVHRMDAGRIYAKRIVDISEDMTTEELNIILQEKSVELIKEELPKYLKGELIGYEQNEDEVVIARNISSEEEFVSFSEKNITSLYNHIRALIDWPIAYGLLDGKRLKFYKVRKLIENHSYQNGELIGLEKDALKIAAKGGYLLAYDIQMEGKKRMNAKDFFHGSGKDLVGKCFE